MAHSISSTIDPPLLNSASPWATTFEDIKALYECPFTGAVTVRTRVTQYISMYSSRVKVLLEARERTASDKFTYTKLQSSDAGGVRADCGQGNP